MIGTDDESCDKKDEGPLIFPLRMHVLLDETEEKYSHIISWLPDGKSFRVHDKDRFAEEVMPTYFDSNKFKTFQRNLNLWGFHTISKGPSKGECSHEAFVRGKPDLCRLGMRRVRINGKGCKRSGMNRHRKVHASDSTADDHSTASGSHQAESVVSYNTPSGALLTAGAAGLAALHPSVASLLLQNEQQAVMYQRAAALPLQSDLRLLSLLNTPAALPCGATSRPLHDTLLLTRAMESLEDAVRQQVAGKLLRELAYQAGVENFPSQAKPATGNPIQKV